MTRHPRTGAPGTPGTNALCPAGRAISLADAGRELPVAVRLAERALGGSQCRWEPSCVFDALTTLVVAGEPAAAEEVAARFEWHTARAAPFAGRISLLRGRIARWYGDLEGAWECYERLYRTCREAALGPAIVAETAELLLARGDQAGARAVLAGGARTVGPAAPELLCARGTLSLAAGDFRTALTEFLRCGRQMLARGMTGPARSAWRRGAARCAHALADRELAAGLAQREHGAALTWGEPRAVGQALAVLAVVAAEGRESELLSEAAELLEVAGAGFEAGETRYELGRRFLEKGEPAFAREQFVRAAEQFRGIGNRDGARRAGEALAGLGEPPGPALTEPEARAACLALGGYSNRDIAAREFVSVRTVELHLSQTYRKLGIRGRRELRTRLPELETGCRRVGISAASPERPSGPGRVC
ncbi:LuxR C-terminal-related transcriptional regulator [Amycolatopsis samaneae]|uniref:LuxR C-terminal-related transcriptional regulator n=1 Tax=Amycolatopsis samaneae TaxID=664691 RepID=A0ABW5GEA3_9PSEU